MFVIDTTTWTEFFDIQSKLHSSLIDESLYSRGDFDVKEYLMKLDGNVIHKNEQIGLLKDTSRLIIELIEDAWYFDMKQSVMSAITEGDKVNAEIVIVKSPVISDLKESYHHIIEANCFTCLRAYKNISSGEKIIVSLEALPLPMINNLRSGIISTIGNGVIVKSSDIPGGGYGLFADRDFEKNEPITFYDGKIIDHKEALQLRESGQATHIGKNSFFLGSHSIFLFFFSSHIVISVSIYQWDTCP